MIGLIECQSLWREAGIKLLAKRKSKFWGKKGKKIINICLVKSNPVLKCCWTVMLPMSKASQKVIDRKKEEKIKKEQVGK